MFLILHTVAPCQEEGHQRGAAVAGSSRRSEEVSCDWWRAGHVIPALTLIGPGGGHQQAQCDGHPPRAEHGDGEETGGARLHRIQVSTVQYSTVQYSTL